jgi:xylulokinase
MMVREAALGFDVGTTSVKAGLLWLDDDGPMEIVGRPYVTSRPRQGWAEQDPKAWVAAMGTCWAELVRRMGPVQVRSVGICSQVNTHVLVDQSLAPTYPAITWQDIRSAPEAAELDARVEGRRTDLWGGPFTVDASFSLSRLAWLARHEPAAWRAGRWLMSPKDYCVSALCGEVVTDTISPIGVVGPDDRYIDRVVELVEGAGRLLPPLRAFDEPAGAVREGNRVGLPTGAPVAVGTMDAWGSVYGSGLVRPGQAMEVSGTSEIIGVLSDRSVPTRGVISFAPVRGRRLHAGPTQAGGGSLDWAARCFSRSIEELLALAADARRDPQPVVFLPHLSGERAPVWNPAARGLFMGLTSSTELRHLALSVLEGVAFSARHLLGECVKAAGLPADELRLSGGGARSPLWNQIKASVHGRPLLALVALDSGVLGAALMGIVAAGIEGDIESAAMRRVKVASQIDPEPADIPRLDDLYGVYRETYDALGPVFSRLARGSNPVPG